MNSAGLPFWNVVAEPVSVLVQLAVLATFHTLLIEPSQRGRATLVTIRSIDLFTVLLESVASTPAGRVPSVKL